MFATSASTAPSLSMSVCSIFFLYHFLMQMQSVHLESLLRSIISSSVIEQCIFCNCRLLTRGDIERSHLLLIGFWYFFDSGSRKTCYTRRFRGKKWTRILRLKCMFMISPRGWPGPFLRCSSVRAKCAGEYPSYLLFQFISSTLDALLIVWLRANAFIHFYFHGFDWSIGFIKRYAHFESFIDLLCCTIVQFLIDWLNDRSIAGLIHYRFFDCSIDHWFSGSFVDSCFCLGIRFDNFRR